MNTGLVWELDPYRIGEPPLFLRLGTIPQFLFVTNHLQGVMKFVTQILPLLNYLIECYTEVRRTLDKPTDLELTHYRQRRKRKKSGEMAKKFGVWYLAPRKKHPTAPLAKLLSESLYWPLQLIQISILFQELLTSKFQWKIRLGVGLVLGTFVGGILLVISRLAPSS